MWAVTSGLAAMSWISFLEIFFFRRYHTFRHAPPHPHIYIANMISALHWIRRGAAAQHPEKYDLDDKEYQRISALAAGQLQDAKADLADALGTNGASSSKAGPTKATPVDDELAEYDLENYDDPPDDDEGQSTTIFSNIKGLTYYPSNSEDPYITLKDKDDEEEERAELEILSTDSLLLAAKTEDDISHLEVYVYESEEENLYVHHDIMLPAFPLCLEWLDFRLGRNAGKEGGGNYVAVGTFDPEIEIWDLDVVDSMYPDAILGQQEGKGKKKRSKKANSDYHTDAVMSLSWNKLHRNLLASSSADTTVKLWDLTTLTCAHSFSHHTSKVQSVVWHPTESTVLLTGSYDRTVAALDSRSPQAVSRWRVSSDVEVLKWDPHRPTHFYVSTEEGMVRYYDGRVADKPVYTLHAHDSAVSALDVNPSVSGCIVTGGVDKLIKVWDAKDDKPTMVTSRDLGLGKIFSASFCPDAPFHLAIAGSKGQVQVWDLSLNPGVRRAFVGRSLLIVGDSTEVAEKNPVGLPDDEEPDSDVEEEKVPAIEDEAVMMDEDDDDDEEEEDEDESEEDV